jgi:hypothetical protein
MTKAQKKVLVAGLKKALSETQEKWDTEGGQSAAYCYGYLIGTIKETINQLEN